MKNPPSRAVDITVPNALLLLQAVQNFRITKRPEYYVLRTSSSSKQKLHGGNNNKK